MGIILSIVALVAGCSEIILVRSTSAAVSLNMVDHRAHVIKERRFVPSPPRIVISQRSVEPLLPDE